MIKNTQINKIDKWINYAIFRKQHKKTLTLDKEYKRDIAKGIDIALPKNYYPNDDPEQKPLLRWRGASNAMYSNWINYYVYQETPFEFINTEKVLSRHQENK